MRGRVAAGACPPCAVRRAGWRSERRPQRCFNAASSLPSTSAWSARKPEASSATNCRTSGLQGQRIVGRQRISGSARRRPCLPKHRCRRRVAHFFSSAGRKTLEAFDAGQVDAVEDHLELPDGQLDAGGGRSGVGEVDSDRLRGVDTISTGRVRPGRGPWRRSAERLRKMKRWPDKGSALRRERTRANRPSKPRTHIDGVGAVPELDGDRQAQHDAPPRASTRERTQSRSQFRRDPPQNGPTRQDDLEDGVQGAWTRTGSRRGAGPTPAACSVESPPVDSAASRRFQE